MYACGEGVAARDPRFTFRHAGKSLEEVSLELLIARVASTNTVRKQRAMGVVVGTASA